MKILVTGSAGHLGEALMRMLATSAHEALGVDIKPSPFTHLLGSIQDRGFVSRCLRGVTAVLHTATLHKPHVATHTRQQFIDTNVTGTLNLLEESLAAGVGSFVFTSTTSVYGRTLSPPPDEPAAWITEMATPQPKNIYGITKLAAEQLCELFHRKLGLPCIILRTSRFFPEADDDRSVRQAYADDNLKVNEFLYRRADIEDVASAHLLAMAKAPTIGFDRYIVSATTPFVTADREALRASALSVVKRLAPDYEREYARRRWSMFPGIDRVYVNERARSGLGWQPLYDFAYVLERLRANDDYRSPLARAIGAKGYHDQTFADGPYPTE